MQPKQDRHVVVYPAILAMALLVLIASVATLPAQAALPLDPTTVPKYADPLVIPPAMPRTGKVKVRGGRNIDYYEIAVRQFTQQILPAGFPATTVWSYGSVTFPATFNYPAFTIETKVGTPVRVKWINQLVNASGGYLSHILPVDQTLHWANPPGGATMRDMHGEDPTPYTGPVPIVTHVHGAHTTEQSDGYPEAWYLPAANNIPAGYAATGTYYDVFKASSPLGSLWTPGSAVFEYPNDQRATTLWYHDHTLGMTRTNVYAGPAGFYILRGGKTDLAGAVLPGPAPALGDPPGMQYYEIPIAIQDRSFWDDGSLFFPDNRAYFEGLLPSQLQIPFIPDPTLGGGISDVSPIWNPEFFGNTMVVNGKTWPVLTVEPRRYRFRLLNGCNSRFLILKLASDPLARPATPALPFWQIGTEGGFLPTPLMLNSLLIGLAERADVIVDFTGLAAGTAIYLVNEGPDEPFGGGIPGVDFLVADPATTGQVMKFVVGAPMSVDTSTPPAALVLPTLTPLPNVIAATRQLSLNEQDSATVLVSLDLAENIVEDLGGVPFGPVRALLGTVDALGMPMPMMWMDAPTETPTVGNTEVWEIFNFTMDAHPIHLHQVMFQVVNREPLMVDPLTGMAAMPATSAGPPFAPEVWETGYKDTVIAYPAQITRVKARFDIPGLFVWHCHIIDHEDNEMMRPYRVLP